MSVKKRTSTIGVGETMKVYCEACRTEFAIHHEPDYTEPEMRKGFGGKPKTLECCPFCGNDDALLIH